MHLVGVVDRPDMHVERAGVRTLDEAAIHQGDAGSGDGDLHATTTGMSSSQTEARRPQLRHTLRTQRGAQIRAEQFRHPIDAPVGERADAHPIHCPELTQQCGERFDDGIVLGIDVHAQIGPCGEQFGEQRDGFATIDQGGAHLIPGQLLDDAGAIGDTVEAVVMEGQDLPVGGEMRIGLDVSIPEFDRPGEGRHRVLGFVARSTTMGEGDGSAVVEEGMRLRAHGASVDASPQRVEPSGGFGTLRPVSATDRFIACVNGPSQDLVLEEAAMLIAAHAHHDLDVTAALASIDELAASVEPGRVESLRTVLFEQHGFGGDTCTYYDPDNSYLDRVLSRRRGIPITLSVLTMAVARRSSIAMEGVGMPGHFLVALSDQPDSYLDPFGAGAVLTATDCMALFHQLHGSSVRFDPSMLAPVGPLSIIERMLNNLLTIFRSDGDLRSQLWVSRLRAHLPQATVSHRADVAMVLANSGQFDAAAEIFECLASLADPETAATLLSARDRMRSRMN